MDLALPYKAVSFGVRTHRNIKTLGIICFAGYMATDLWDPM